MMNNNNGGGGSSGAQGSGGGGSSMRQSQGMGKQIGKTGLDFNLTQPVQITNNIGGPQQTTNLNSTTTGAAPNFGPNTQANLHKIIRQMNKQQTAAAVAMIQGNSQDNKQSNQQNQGSNNTSGVSKRKSSSNKNRRVELTINQGSTVATNAKPSSSSNHNTHSSIQSNEPNTANAGSVSSSKNGRLLKVSLVSDNMGQKVPGRASRNPRQVDSRDGVPLLPPASQSNTNPVVGNAGLSFNLNQQPQPIAPSMGMESGGGHSVNKQSAVARSASGKRLGMRSSDPNVAKQINQSQDRNNAMKYATRQDERVASQLNSQAESRFATAPQKFLHTEPSNNQQNPLSGNVQVLASETGLQLNSHSQQPNPKYFSQRIQNQIRKKSSSGEVEKQRTDGNQQPARTSKEEILRAYIKPSNAQDAQKSSDHEEPNQPNMGGEHPSQAQSAANELNGFGSLKARLAQRNSTKSQGSAAAAAAAAASGSNLNELGGIPGGSFDKITAKANKIRQGTAASTSSTNHHEEPQNSQQPSNKLSQAANSFRAKLLRQHDSNSSGGSGRGQGSNSRERESKNVIKDEAAPLINPLNTLKKSLKKDKDAEEEKKKELIEKQKKSHYRVLKALEEEKHRQEERNLGPDDIVEYRGMRMTLSQREEYMEMEEEQIIKFRQNYYPAKFASKKNGVVVTYAANTHQGMVRSYNEDRVSIILNIIKPKFKQIDFWPRCSFFAIYDGHGGAQCADFLRDQLHQMIVRDSDFPQNPIKAMQRGFEQAEQSFLEFAHGESQTDGGSVQRSGSCAIVVLIVGDVAYVANVGDSRAFMSTDEGQKIVQLSIDHKPEYEEEQARIESNGGKVYQNQSFIPDPSPSNKSGTQTLIGPHRVFPGRLSVSRTIGDIEAKDERYGGNPNVVIAIPEIRAFKIKENYDFIVIGCDGVYEKMDNQEVMDQIYEAALQPENLKQPMSMHARCGSSVDGVLNQCVNQKTLDNITCVIIGFNGFEKLIEKARTTGGRNDRVRDAEMIADETSLNWDEEMAAIDNSNSNNVINKLAKPLEPVEEEMIENSELETPLSEVIEVTRKKQLASRGQIIADSRNEVNSHQTSVSDKFADSSRRQSQLLESQDTQNVIDHDLPSISLVSSKRQLTQESHRDHNQIEQAQNNAPQEDQQAGVQQRRSAERIGLGASNNSDSNSLLPALANEQGLTRPNFVQKDYKIRQASASPTRVQRQNSDRIIRRQQDSQPTLNTSVGRQPDLQRQPEQKITPLTAQLNKNPSHGGVSSLPPQINQPRGTVSIPVTRTAKTPIAPNASSGKGANIGSRNLIDLKPGQESSKTVVNTQQHPQSTGGMRPITPKRMITLQQKGAGSTQYGHQRTQDSIPLRDSKDFDPRKSNRQSARRRDEKLQSDHSQPKINKKMTQNNWVDGASITQPPPQHVAMSSSFSNNIKSVSAHQQNAGHGGLSSSKNMNDMSKQFIAKMTGYKAHHAQVSASNKNRSQRVNETIKNLVHNTQNAMPAAHQTQVEQLLKDQIHDLQQQYNSFNGQLTKQVLNQEPAPAKSNSNPPVRGRKKSSGKQTQGSVRPTSLNNTQQISMRPTAELNSNHGMVQVDTTHVATNYHHLPTTNNQSTSMKQQRSSASRNKPNTLHPVISSNANNNNLSQGQNAPPTITLNMNQINLTGGSNRIPQQPIQQHHSQLSQPNYASNYSQGNPVVQQQQTSQGKQWYSNTINLSGIKQYAATNTAKQGGAAQASGQAPGGKQGSTKRHRD